MSKDSIKKRKQHGTKHTTAISPMRAYCVYAGTLPASKKKKNTSAKKMELIGRIERRKIYYVQIRNNPTWKKSIPKRDWVAFTIADKEDKELVPPIVKECLDRNVSYTCSAGNYANMTEDFFDEEIAWRGVEYETRTKKEFNYNYSPNTTAHQNFGEGFWFAAILAKDDKFDIDKIVCVDFTKKKVKNHLIDLIQKINNGWLPSDEEIKSAEYDD